MKSLLVVTGLDSMLQETSNHISHKKSLSVLIHQNGLSFFTHNALGVLDQWHHDLNAPAHPVILLREIEELFNSNTGLQQSFDTVSLVYHHEMFTLVPSTYFSAEYASDYLKYNVHLLSNDIISYDDGLNNGKITVVYLAYENINNFFFSKYGQFEYYHYSSYLINDLTKNQPANTTSVVLEVFTNDFYLSILKDQQLISHNLFKHDTIEDVLYYVMFSIQQHELDPEQLICTLKSKSDLTKLHELLYNYIRTIVVHDDYNTYITQLLCV